MKEVFIKYNPYNLETEITVDKKCLKQNSKLGEKLHPNLADARLQDWVEDVPQLLIDEYNDTEFKVIFHGTLLDYEDLKEVFDKAAKKGKPKFSCELSHIPAKETSDKEGLIDDVFKEIQNGPFAELNTDEVRHAYDLVKSDNFEVCVVATMSAGKSTLINAMLRAKLMPSRMEACTAKITRIADDCSKEAGIFQAEVCDGEGKKIATENKLTCQIMEGLNSNDNVSEIKIKGKIPFMSAEDVSLVLIDTPGPNNSRDTHHQKVQSELLEKSSKPLLLYIMTGEFGTEDDNNLLTRIADSMAVGGKQSKDRFIFVVNKLDDRKKEDGDTSQTLERVRAYLDAHDIKNPNLFPAAALPALNIQLMLSGVELDDDTKDETEAKIKKLNRNDALHFETFATLPFSLKEETRRQFEKACADWGNADKLLNPLEALIHTGVPSIEAAIRQYVRKYSKTAKIKNLVSTFKAKIMSTKCYEYTKQQLIRDEKKREEILKMIDSIRQKISDGEEALKFESAVDDEINKINNRSIEVVESIIQKFQGKITKRIDDLHNSKFTREDALDELKRLQRFAERLNPDFEVQLDDLIHKNLVATCKVLFEEYKNKLASLMNDITVTDSDSIAFDPLKIMGGSVGMDDISIQRYINTKKVENGTEWVENTNKAWYKPWTWGEEDGYKRIIYKTVEYVNGGTFAQELLQPLQKNIYENGNVAKRHLHKESKRIGALLKEELKNLDGVLKAKLIDLEKWATQGEKTDEQIRESKQQLKWLEDIQGQIESILEI